MDCHRPLYGRGLCSAHYYQMKKAGTLNTQHFRRAGGSAEDRLRWHGWDVTDDGCWEWKGSRGRRGYGQVRVGGKSRKAHRLAYEVWNGPIPKGLYVCHSCNNPPCINPAHLRTGTHADNMTDRSLAGHYGGKYSGASKLDADKVRQIRKMREAGATYPQIASKFGVKRGAVGDIIRGKTWAHVK